ncbi:hypothetical protein SDC9_191807 [bioreactor metagenome]|uniref:DUF86 domain-containing protein n=1 Tax=bioreactor metagenome TaxID=1076179 RepID=A0A645HYX8_9ZZZZ
MKTEKDLFRLGHIKDCIIKILELVKISRTFENFEVKWIEQDAMIRNFEIIGEASNHISDETKEKHPEVEWNLMRRMRNFISHEYFGVDLENIWETAVHDIPILNLQIEQIISDLSKP